MSSLSTLPKGDSAWLLRKAIERIMQQVSVLETNIGSSTTGNSANTQIIFNDDGTLRGDAGLTFNKTTDTISTARITTSGDAIVCSSTGDFYVGSTVTPQFKIERATGNATITGDLTVSTAARFNGGATAGYLNGSLFFGSSGNFTNLYCKSSGYVLYNTAGTFSVLNIDNSGVATFQDGSGGSRMTLNSNGLGVGIVPGSGIAPVLLGVGVAKTAGTSTGYQIYQGSTEVVRFATDNTNIYIQGITNLPMRFYTNNVNTMTLDASGNLLVGVTSSGNRLDIQKSTDCTVLVKSTGANTNIAMDYVSSYGNHTIRKSGTAVWDYGVINDSSATPAFKISNASAVGVQLVSGATAWTTLSDETVKDIIEPITNAITKVGSLRSVIGKFKTDDASKRRSFLIAQDVFAVLPEAVDVVGEKNELGVRYSDVIPLLVAAIKELSAEVNALKNA